jgi:hypothetical protein
MVFSKESDQKSQAMQEKPALFEKAAADRFRIFLRGAVITKTREGAAFFGDDVGC